MLCELFVISPIKERHQKKVRGLYRRADSILRDAKRFSIAFDSSDCFDYDHWHMDWDGIGNANTETRLVTIQAHAIVFATIASQSGDLSKPFQLFISIPKRDSGQDAVYLHTENPRSAFPIDFSDVSWGVPELEALLSTFIPNFRIVVGQQEFNYIAYAQGVGVPLQGSARA